VRAGQCPVPGTGHVRNGQVPRETRAATGAGAGARGAEPGTDVSRRDTSGARHRDGSGSGRVRDGLVRSEAAQGVRFDLPNTLARDPELAADLLERGRLAAAEAEAQRD